MTRADVVVRDGKTYNITVQDGTQISKGIEFDLIANPIAGLNLILDIRTMIASRQKLPKVYLTVVQ
jgi:hypothetical protein